jgi:hypothetical protein
MSELSEEIRKQIEEAASAAIRQVSCDCPEEFHLVECSIPGDFVWFIKGATHQHGIAFYQGHRAGWNEAVNNYGESFSTLRDAANNMMDQIKKIEAHMRPVMITNAVANQAFQELYRQWKESEATLKQLESLRKP